MYVILAVVAASALFTGCNANCPDEILSCTQTFLDAFTGLDLSSDSQVCGTANSAYSSLESCMNGLKATYPSCEAMILDTLNGLSESKSQIDDVCGAIGGAAAVSISLFTLLAMLLTHYLTST